MENEKLQTADQIREAIGVLAQAHTELEAVVKAQAGLIESMHLRIQALTSLIDSHHETFIKHGWARPRPTEDNRAN
jgi:hypothetical protein